MVAATLVDIIRRFKVNKTSSPGTNKELYSDFSDKVNLLLNIQLNTHILHIIINFHALTFKC